MDDYSPTHLQQQAIQAALSSDWEEALRLNKQIINSDPKNVEALNRLGRAYFELGKLTESRKNFETTLIFDPYNQIASKFLKRIEAVSKKGIKLQNHDSQIYQSPLNCDLFIEEPGKTKIIFLLKVAEPQKLFLLSAGMTAQLVVKNRGIAVADQHGDYLGVLPDDISHHLIRLIKGGNKYQAFIKTIKANGLSILIREIFRSSRFRNQPSFLDNLNFDLAYSSGNIVVTEENEEPYPQEEENV